MGVLGRELACFYLLLLLIMSQLEAPCYAVGYGRFSSSKGGSISELKNSPARSNSMGGLKGNADKDGGEILDLLRLSLWPLVLLLLLLKKERNRVAVL
ncbi:hypothetical protein SADUNF_Sadunf16G0031300 [Salix dunnii]|uniref:Glycine-rich protein n=1 Tax=Salix dunnii TaxID=1413687 RepID=A0A835J6U4_9ROSI|nr:hypothetical protein SADUNF_Sadunf16G0031300 [Salix dunnii]